MVPLTATLSSSPVISSEIEPLRLAAVRGEVIERGGDEAGDAAFHVDGAAAVKHVARDLAGERRMAPGRLVARRHHVGVAGEHQIGLRGADAGIEISIGAVPGSVKTCAMHGEAGLLQHALQISQRAALLRRHRTAAEQIAGDGDRIGGHRE